jgi:hypothetical protein
VTQSLSKGRIVHRSAGNNKNASGGAFSTAFFPQAAILSTLPAAQRSALTARGAQFSPIPQGDLLLFFEIR